MYTSPTILCSLTILFPLVHLCILVRLVTGHTQTLTDIRGSHCFTLIDCTQDNLQVWIHWYLSKL